MKFQDRRVNLSKDFALIALFMAGVLSLSSCGSIDSQPQNVNVAENGTSGSGNLFPPIDPSQPILGSFTYGPDLAQFPSGINPLTGLPVDDPAALNLPAVLISIMNFPAYARPQAGLSFAPMIFEIYIGDGETRFLVVFYGEEPYWQEQVFGSCEVRQGPFEENGYSLGNLVWFDINHNGQQELNEPGIGGVCVTLYDTFGNEIQNTSTDSNGYYGFDVESEQSYVIRFEKPVGLDFTSRDVGYDDLDSDADPVTGKTTGIVVESNDLTWDAGFFLDNPTPAPTESHQVADAGTENITLPPVEIGPIRSGRLPYRYITNFFPGSCLVYASASADVQMRLPSCYIQYGSDSKDITSALLDVTKMRELAEGNQDLNVPINYSGNIFSDILPEGGQPAQELNIIWSYMNQTLWHYDSLSGAYLRYSNTPDDPNHFIPETDRLTMRQLLVDNIIVIFANHIAQSPTLIDIDLGIGNRGQAYLFRDGQMFPIYWSTMAGAYEQQTGLMRPMRFVDADGNAVALKPGHTWVHTFTPGSFVYEKQTGSGIWVGDFEAPPIIPQ